MPAGAEIASMPCQNRQAYHLGRGAVGTTGPAPHMPGLIGA